MTDLETDKTRQWLESDKNICIGLRPLAEPFDEAALLTEPWDLKATWASSGGLIQVDVAGKELFLATNQQLCKKTCFDVVVKPSLVLCVPLRDPVAL